MTVNGIDFIQISVAPKYFISKCGKVFSSISSKFISQHKTRYGYVQVMLLTKDGMRKGISVHRLVATAFIPNPENKPQVNHIDGNKENNNLSNLEWSTASENIRHALTTGLNIPKGNHRRRLVDTETGKSYSSVTEAAKDIQMGRTTLNAMLSGQNRNITPLRYL